MESNDGAENIGNVASLASMLFAPVVCNRIDYGTHDDLATFGVFIFNNLRQWIIFKKNNLNWKVLEHF